jgi:hypothetical protein
MMEEEKVIVRFLNLRKKAKKDGLFLFLSLVVWF